MVGPEPQDGQSLYVNLGDAGLAELDVVNARFRELQRPEGVRRACSWEPCAPAP